MIMRQLTNSKNIPWLSYNDHIAKAAAELENSVVSGPSALALYNVGHLEGPYIYLRPISRRSFVFNIKSEISDLRYYAPVRCYLRVIYANSQWYAVSPNFGITGCGQSYADSIRDAANMFVELIALHIRLGTNPRKASRSVSLLEEIEILGRSKISSLKTGFQPTCVYLSIDLSDSNIGNGIDIYPSAIRKNKIVCLSGVLVEPIKEAFKTTRALKIFDKDQIEEAEEDAKAQGLM